ncbi:hypothetical protein DFH11DRAFT_1548447 [Phellopilus nigrolimitatus]|nr:hypothetical protein DFH11DRAFT_1548447 [Phellopilus nigrolimitatus]
MKSRRTGPEFSCLERVFKLQFVVYSQKFRVTCAYKSLVDLVLPDPSALEYIPFLLYKARTLMLNQVKAVETEDTEAFPLKAARERCRQPAPMVVSDSAQVTALRGINIIQDLL